MSENCQQKKKVLLCVESPLLITYVQDALGTDFCVHSITNTDDVILVTEEFNPDLVIFDIPDETALNIFRSFKATQAQTTVPIVILSDDEEVQTQAFELGATDCLRRSLAPSVFKWKIRKLVAGRQSLENLEDSLAEANRKIEELESFLQMVAHDLKSPAAAVCGFVRLLKRTASRIALDERINEILGHLSNASNTIQEFLQDISAFMVTEQMNLTWAPLKIEEAIEEVLDQHRHLISEKKIDLKLNFGSTGLMGMGDKLRIQQVLDNLVRNAIFHMGEVAEPLICVMVEEQNDFIVAGISDNGIGIPDEYKEQVFDKYFRVPRRGLQAGTGLGLFIAKCIVENHGGRIWIDSTPDGGTTVNFTVPKHAPTN